MNLKQVEGVIIIVGNEPFTHPAIQVSDDTAYVIECNDEERKIFFDNQGEKYRIYYNEIKSGEAGSTINMKKFEKLDK